MTSRTPFCFAAPAYANSVPLAQFIPEVCPGATVILDHPAKLLKRLDDRTVDAGLIPVADLFAHSDLDRIEGLGICAEKKVRSVLLRCSRPLDKVRTVRLDAASRTSNALAKILLRLHWKREASFLPPDAAGMADAEVVIGDRALCTPPGVAGDLDLATAWNQMTGLPFVFAVWVFRRDHPDPAGLARVVNAAKQAGLAALPQIARAQALSLGLTEADCADYFTTCIYYDVGPREVQAMEQFRQSLESHNYFGQNLQNETK